MRRVIQLLWSLLTRTRSQRPAEPRQPEVHEAAVKMRPLAPLHFLHRK